MEDKCIFCAIVGSQIPSFKVYEDSNFIAFLDIRPVNKGHALVVSKKHYQWTYDVPEFGAFFEVGKKIAMAQIKALDAKFVNFITMGLGVKHAHIHVIPRYENDGHAELPNMGNVKEMTETEMRQIAEKIKNNIPREQPKVEEKVEEQEPVKEKEWTEEELEFIRKDMKQT